MDLLVTGMSLSTESEATCPDVDPAGCAEEPLPDHIQNGSLSWVRMALHGSFGLGEGWIVSGLIPLDFRALDLSFTRMDGSAYHPPYANDFETTTQRYGVGDPELSLSKVFRWPKGWVLAVRAGTRLPAGAVEEENLQLGRIGNVQRQFQLGTGTVQPIASMHLLRQYEDWRALVGGNVRLSVWENRYGLKPGSFLGIETSISREFGEKTEGLLGLSFNHTEPDQWEDWADGGTETLEATLGVTRHLGLQWLIEARAHTMLWENRFGVAPAESTTKKVQMIFGLSWRN